MSHNSISFIIPALNESKSIDTTISSILKYCPKDIFNEIIVCDNGSSDETVSIAKKRCSKVLQDTNASIGELRNIGAKKADGDILVFLDADVRLTNDWFLHIHNTLDLVNREKSIITGSKCGIHHPPSWIEKNWFEPQIRSHTETPKYINSGHMIVPKSFFISLGGFNENLITGEDYDLGKRARQSGGKIFNNKLLRVEHEGYPKNIPEFVRREIWHGVGDYQSTKEFLSSKVALVSLFVSALSFLFLYLILTDKYIPSLIVLSSISLISFFSYLFKTKTRLPFTTMLYGSLITYIYFLSRSISPFKLLIDSLKVKTIKTLLS